MLESQGCTRVGYTPVYRAVCQREKNTGGQHGLSTSRVLKPCVKEEQLAWIQRATRFGDTPKIQAVCVDHKRRKNTSFDRVAHTG